MSHEEEKRRVLYLPDGIRFESGPDAWRVPPVVAEPGDWLAIAPDGPEPVVDPAVPLSRIIATMLEPEIGEVEIFGKKVYRIDYGIRLRLRVRIGFVHGYGGLLSNRTIKENIALPVSVHGHMSMLEETDVIDYTLKSFGLTEVADMNPHEVDGGTRWNVCLARAMVLRPEWLVLEGLGNWEMDRGSGTSWKCLMDRRHTSDMATAICLPRQNPGFETWFEKLGGRMIWYSRIEPNEGRR